MDLANTPQKYSIQETENIHSSLVLGTVFKIGHCLGPKPSLNKYKNIEIIPFIIPDHSDIKLEINRRLTSDITQILGDHTFE